MVMYSPGFLCSRLIVSVFDNRGTLLPGAGGTRFPGGERYSLGNNVRGNRIHSDTGFDEQKYLIRDANVKSNQSKN